MTFGFGAQDASLLNNMNSSHMPPDRPSIEKWAVSTKLVPLKGGRRNTVLLAAGRSRSVVFKSTRRSSESVAWLLEVQDQARNAGFVVPRLLQSINGNLVEDGWTCEEYVEGSYIERAELSCIAPYLHSFHEATSMLAQRPQFQSSNGLLRISTGGDVNLSKMPKELVRKCRDAWRAVASRPQSIIHGDLNVRNILVTSEGRYALLDWDECRRDLVLFDRGQIEEDDEAARRARTAWEVACSWIVEPEHARALTGLL